MVDQKMLLGTARSDGKSKLCVFGAEEDLGIESSQTTRTHSTGNHGCCARCGSGGSTKGHETRAPRRTVRGPLTSQKCWCTPNSQIETPWSALNESSSPFPRSQICIASTCLRDRWTTTSGFQKVPAEMSLPSAWERNDCNPPISKPLSQREDAEKPWQGSGHSLFWCLDLVCYKA
jgi:hypothetical protein